jgi:hypothetical protein
MKKSLATLATLLVGCATGAAVQGIAAQSFAPNPSAPRWEVLCVAPVWSAVRQGRVDETMSAHMHEIGMSGWEPVGISWSHQANARFCFKRPAP